MDRALIQSQVTHVASILQRRRLPLTREAWLQTCILQALQDAEVPAVAEVKLGPGNRIDFVAYEKIGIEVKVGTYSAAEVARQLRRYCEFPQLEAIVLVSSKTFDFRRVDFAKPVVTVSLAGAWL